MTELEALSSRDPLPGEQDILLFLGGRLIVLCLMAAMSFLSIFTQSSSENQFRRSSIHLSCQAVPKVLEIQL